MPVLMFRAAVKYMQVLVPSTAAFCRAKCELPFGLVVPPGKTNSALSGLDQAPTKATNAINQAPKHAAQHAESLMCAPHSASFPKSPLVTSKLT